MKKLLASAMTLASLFVVTFAISSQPPDEKNKPFGKKDQEDGADRKKKKDDGPEGKKGPPPYELGKIIPPHLRNNLDLSDAQQDAITKLEAEVRQKLLKILTPEQVRRIGEMKKKKNDDGPPPKKDRRPKDDDEKKKN